MVPMNRMLEIEKKNEIQHSIGIRQVYEQKKHSTCNSTGIQYRLQTKETLNL